MVMIIIMCFFFTKWKRPIKVRMYDFIHIYIFSLYSFLGQSKTQITCDFESLAAATHVGLLNTSTTPHKTTSTRPEILFCHWFCVSLAKFWVRKSTKPAGSILPNINFFLWEGVKIQNNWGKREVTSALPNCLSVCLTFCYKYYNIM